MTVTPTPYTTGKRSALVAYCFQLARKAPQMTVREAETLLALSRAVKAVERDRAGRSAEHVHRDLMKLADRATDIVQPYGLSVTFYQSLTIHSPDGEPIPVPTI